MRPSRPRTTAIPGTVDRLPEKRLPFFVLWFERWKRERDRDLSQKSQQLRVRRPLAGDLTKP